VHDLVSQFTLSAQPVMPGLLSRQHADTGVQAPLGRYAAHVENT
jgi:hypothetical protein